MEKHSGVVYQGNIQKLKSLMQRANMGEKITIGFIGGSITQGCAATKEEFCYAYRVYKWWEETFSNSTFHYINAGIGATDSEFACARVQEDLLKWNPDFIIVEFSVNDECSAHFQETYEGLIRQILSYEKNPAVMLLHNVFYEDGHNAQMIHMEIGKYYDIPCVSVKNTIYSEIESGRLTRKEVTSDNLHPNDLGHKLVAQTVTDYLNKIKSELITKEEALISRVEKSELMQPLTKNAYENSKRYNRMNCSPVMKEFVSDTNIQDSICDIFKNGWYATKKGAELKVTLQAKCIAVQYRKTICKPAPVAILILDGQEDKGVRLDANFEEDWGDKLVLQDVLEETESREHEIVVRIIETHEDDKLPFYLTSFLISE